MLRYEPRQPQQTEDDSEIYALAQKLYEEDQLRKAQEAEANKRTVANTVGDLAAAGVAGVIDIPKAFAGLSDLSTVPVRKLAGALGFDMPSNTQALANIGIDFNEAQRVLRDEVQSNAMRAARKNVSQAFDEGFGKGLLAATTENPMVALDAVVQSTPSMLGAGAAVQKAATTIGARAAAAAGGMETAAGRAAAQAAVEAAAPRLATIAAAAEGAQAAGTAAADRARDGLTDREALGALATGVSTGLLGKAVGAAASKLKLADDAELLLAGVPSRPGGGLLAIPKTALREGAEEFAQSGSEQLIGNITDQRPITEGLGEAAGLGLIAGAGQGGGTAAASRMLERAKLQAENEAARAAREAARPGNNPGNEAESTPIDVVSPEDLMQPNQDELARNLGLVDDSRPTNLSPEELGQRREAAQAAVAEAVAQADNTPTPSAPADVPSAEALAQRREARQAAVRQRIEGREAEPAALPFEPAPIRQELALAEDTPPVESIPYTRDVAAPDLQLADVISETGNRRGAPVQVETNQNRDTRAEELAALNLIDAPQPKRRRDVIANAREQAAKDEPVFQSRTNTEPRALPTGFDADAYLALMPRIRRSRLPMPQRWEQMPYNERVEAAANAGWRKRDGTPNAEAQRFAELGWQKLPEGTRNKVAAAMNAWLPDKEAKPKRVRSLKPDAEYDTVLEFIAKSGGITPGGPLANDLRIAAGIDPNRNAKGFGIKHVFAKKGQGISLSRMTERLWEAGYISENNELELINRLSDEGDFMSLAGRVRNDEQPTEADLFPEGMNTSANQNSEARADYLERAIGASNFQQLHEQFFDEEGRRLEDKSNDEYYIRFEDWLEEKILNERKGANATQPSQVEPQAASQTAPQGQVRQNAIEQQPRRRTTPGNDDRPVVEADDDMPAGRNDERPAVFSLPAAAAPLSTEQIANDLRAAESRLRSAYAQSGQPSPANLRLRQIKTPPRADTMLAEQVAKALGRNVVFVANETGEVPFAGAYIGNTIYLSQDARNKALPVVMHEIFHSMPNDLRRQTVAAIMETVTPAQREAFAKEFPAYQQNEFDEELAARIIEMDAQNPAFWNRLSERMGKSAFGDLARHILRMLDMIMSRFAGRDDARKFTSDLERVRTVVADAFAKVQEQGLAAEPRFSTVGGATLNGRSTIEVDGRLYPVQRSDGRLIYPTEEGVRNFWRWFGDSKMTDAFGRPIVLYHGSDRDISAFERDRPIKKDTGWFGQGIYLTADPFSASAYSQYEQMRGTEELQPGRVMPLYAKVTRPYSWPSSDKPINSREAAKKFQEDMRARGRDGVVVRNRYAKDDYANHYEVVVFDPENIKSASGNNGDFDPQTPQVLLSAQPASRTAEGFEPHYLNFDKLRGKTVREQVRIADTGEIVTVESDPETQLAEFDKRLADLQKVKACL